MNPITLFGTILPNRYLRKHFISSPVYAGRFIMLIFSCQSVYLVYKV